MKKKMLVVFLIFVIVSSAFLTEKTFVTGNNINLETWEDDFDYNSLKDMKTAGWIIGRDDYTFLKNGMIILNNDGVVGTYVLYKRIPSGIYNWIVESKGTWIGRSYGSLHVVAKTERHTYIWWGDGYYKEFVFSRDGKKIYRIPGYNPKMNEWHRFTLKKEGNKLYMYFDGRLITTYTERDIVKSQLVAIGMYSSWIGKTAYDYIRLTRLPATQGNQNVSEYQVLIWLADPGHRNTAENLKQIIQELGYLVDMKITDYEPLTNIDFSKYSLVVIIFDYYTHPSFVEKIDINSLREYVNRGGKLLGYGDGGLVVSALVLGVPYYSRLFRGKLQVEIARSQEIIKPYNDRKTLDLGYAYLYNFAYFRNIETPLLLHEGKIIGGISKLGDGYVAGLSTTYSGGLMREDTRYVVENLVKWLLSRNKKQYTVNKIKFVGVVKWVDACNPITPQCSGGDWGIDITSILLAPRDVSNTLIKTRQITVHLDYGHYNQFIHIDSVKPGDIVEVYGVLITSEWTHVELKEDGDYLKRISESRSQIVRQAFSTINSLKKGVEDAKNIVIKNIPESPVTLVGCAIDFIPLGEFVPIKNKILKTGVAVITKKVIKHEIKENTKKEIAKLEFNESQYKFAISTLNQIQWELYSLDNKHLDEYNNTFIRDMKNYYSFISNEGINFPILLKELEESHEENTITKDILITGGEFLLIPLSGPIAHVISAGAKCLVDFKDTGDFLSVLSATFNNQTNMALSYSEDILYSVQYLVNASKIDQKRFPSVRVYNGGSLVEISENNVVNFSNPIQIPWGQIILPGNTRSITVENTYTKPLKVKVIIKLEWKLEPYQETTEIEKSRRFAEEWETVIAPNDEKTFKIDSLPNPITEWFDKAHKWGYNIKEFTHFYVIYGEQRYQAMKEFYSVSYIKKTSVIPWWIRDQWIIGTTTTSIQIFSTGEWTQLIR
ncbi:hypothetical protein [Thermococcus sp.]